MAKGNGLISHQDLKNYDARWRQPVEANYKNYHIVSMPPPSSGGIIILQLMKIMERFPLAEWGFQSLNAVHLMAEAERRVELRARVKALVAAQDWEGPSEAHAATLRFLAAPTDVNWGGKVHGGILMRWLDETGYVCASAWSHTHVVSRFSGGVSFLRPIRIGDLVEIQGRLVHTGRTSMHIALRVLAGSPRTGELELATQCTSVYVALDAEGRPDPVPTWSPTTSVDLAAQQHAVEFMALRTDPAFHSPRPLTPPIDLPGRGIRPSPGDG